MRRTRGNKEASARGVPEARVEIGFRIAELHNKAELQRREHLIIKPCRIALQQRVLHQRAVADAVYRHAARHIKPQLPGGLRAQLLKLRQRMARVVGVERMRQRIGEHTAVVDHPVDALLKLTLQPALHIRQRGALSILIVGFQNMQFAPGQKRGEEKDR